MREALFVVFIFTVAGVFAQAQKPKAKVVDTQAASVQRGAAVYTKECLSCHQADGGGVPRLNPPLFENTDVVGDKDKIISIVLKGMSDRVPIDGEYYSNSMASHSYLTNQQIADVLTYIRSSFGNKASKVTADDVKKLRATKGK